MSRRASRRKGRAGGRQQVGRWAGRALGLMAGLLLAGVAVGYLQLRAYLHSEEFRAMLGAQVGKTLGVRGSFEPFRWDGLQVRTGGFEGEGEGLLSGLRAAELRTEVGLGGVRQGVWQLMSASVRRLEIDLNTVARPAEAAAEAAVAGAPAAAGPESKRRRAWIPDRAELRELRVDDSRLRVKTGGGEVVAAGQNWLVAAGAAPGSYNLEAAGGTLEHPWSWAPPLRVDRARLRWQGQRLSITDITADVFDKGHLSGSGEAEFDRGEYSFEGGLEGVRCDELLPDDWKQRVRGQVSADFSVRGRGGEAVTSGKVRVKDGVLTALPVLDRLAAYANTARFRVLPLQEARASFIKRGERLSLTDIVISSEGLVRLEGRMEIVGDKLDGYFRLGLAPGTLATIPGAESKVFVEQERGLLWAPLRITGTVDSPKEDLSERLLAAAGERMFELIPETGELALKFTRSVLGEGGREAVRQGVDTVKEGTGGLIRGATDTVREGLGGLFDLLPGKEEKR